MHSPRRSRLLLALIFAPVLMASKCRRDKDKVIDDDDTIVPVAPTFDLKVTGVEPDEVTPGQLTRGVVYGDGFEAGVEVRVNESPVSSVTFQDSKVLRITLPPLEPGAYDLRVRNPDGTTATLRNAVIARAPAVDPTAGLRCRNLTLQFEYDSSTLTQDSMDLLTENMACFKERSGEIRIEGHCDERGTTDYNLALGQRRADAVKGWLINQAVAGRRMRTVSYGEERPAVQGSNENAWAENRRAVVTVSK